jgi:hypothetical protein
MKQSELINSIKVLSKYVGEEKLFDSLIDELTFPEVIKTLIYHLFLIKFNSYNSPVYLFNAYQKVFEYITQIESLGFYEFLPE